MSRFGFGWYHQDPNPNSAPPAMVPCSGSHCSPLLSHYQLQTHVTLPNIVSSDGFFHKPSTFSLDFTGWAIICPSLWPDDGSHRLIHAYIESFTPGASKGTGQRMRGGQFSQSRSADTRSEGKICWVQWLQVSLTHTSQWGTTQSLWLLSSCIEINWLCCCCSCSEMEH